MNKTDAEEKAVRERYNKLGPRVAEALKKRRFDAYYVPQARDAAAQLFKLIPGDHIVSWGGSMTMDALGVSKNLVDRGYRVIDRDSAKSPEERQELMRRALTCDTFITGTNALSEGGELVNIDNAGNRVAAMCFGPKSVVLLIGMNKVAKTLEDAVRRARTIAAPTNMQRFTGMVTPCAINGACSDCTAADCICSYIVITRQSKPAGRIKVILIGEDIGF